MIPVQLKIKGIALAEEARAIRAQEKRLKRKAAKAREKIRQMKAGQRTLLFPEQVQSAEKNVTMHFVNPLFSIQHHRRIDIRKESRASHLACCYLRGTPYHACEDPEITRSKPNWDRVVNIVLRYGPETDARVVNQKIEEWRQANG